MERRISVNKIGKICVLFIILIPFIQQRTLSELPIYISKMYRFGTYISILLIWMVLFRQIKTLFQSKFVLVMTLFFTVYILATIVNSFNDIDYVLYNTFSLYSLSLFLYYEIKTNIDDLLHVLNFIYSLFIYLEFITDILFPQGLYKTSTYHTAHLLGDDNAIIYVFLPGIIIMIINSIHFKGKISFYVWIAIILGEVLFFRMFAVSAIISFTLFIVLLVYTIKIKELNPKVLLSGVLFVVFAVLFGLTLHPIQVFIESVLHKDVTLSSRTILWEYAFDMIQKNILLGYGGFFQKGRFTIGWNTYPAHTPYLQLLIDGGIILFFIFMALLIWSFRTVSIERKSIICCVCAIGLSCILVNYITEYAGLNHIIIIITLMINSKELWCDSIQMRRMIRFKYI